MTVDVGVNVFDSTGGGRIAILLLGHGVRRTPSLWAWDGTIRVETMERATIAVANDSTAAVGVGIAATVDIWGSSGTVGVHFVVGSLIGGETILLKCWRTVELDAMQG